MPTDGSVGTSPTPLPPQVSATGLGVWGSWRLDAAALLGILVLVSYLLPARLVLPGLGEAGIPAMVLGLGMLVWWFATRLVPGSFVGGRHPLRAALLIFGLVLLISYALGLARGLPVAELSATDRAMLRFAGLIGIALVALDGITSLARLNALLRVLVAAAALMAVVGSLQFLVGVDITPYLRPPGLVLNQELLGVTSRGEGVTRVAATANHYIEFGVLMAMIAPIGLHLAQFSTSTGRRVVFSAVTALLLMSALFSVSRSAIVALLVAVLFMLPAWRLRGTVNVLAMLVGAVLLVRLAFPSLVATFLELFSGAPQDSSVRGRTSDYDVVLPLINDRPWFGRGPGTYSPLRYVLLDNQWLNSMVTIGVVGALALATVFVLAFSLAKRVGRFADEDATRNLGHTIGASLAAGVAASFLFDSLAFSTFAVTMFVLVGLAGALWRLAGRPAPGQGGAAGTP